MSFTAEHFASTETGIQKNITTTMTLAGRTGWCAAMMSFVIHQHLYKAITQQVKNLVRFKGWGFLLVWFFSVACETF